MNKKAKIKLTITYPTYMDINVNPTWSRKESLTQEFPNLIKLEEHDGGYVLILPQDEVDMAKRVQEAIEDGDNKDNTYNQKREQLAKNFVEIPSLCIEENNKYFEEALRMDGIICDCIDKRNDFLKKKDYSIAATFGADANELIRFRNFLVENDLKKATKLVQKMDTMCRDRIPEDIFKMLDKVYCRI